MIYSLSLPIALTLTSQWMRSILMSDAFGSVLNGYVQEVSAVSRPLKAESRALADKRDRQ